MGIRPVRMLSGDNRTTAERVGQSLGLDAVDAELLPQDKLAIIAAMRTGPDARRVAFIGDGVNDAPALAAADASVAIGTIGTAAALETADIVLLTDHLGSVPWAIALARRARRVVVANLVFALSIIAVMAVVTLASSLRHAEIPLAAGVLAHEGGTLLVVLNSLRLLRFPPPPAPLGAPPGFRGGHPPFGVLHPSAKSVCL